MTDAPLPRRALRRPAIIVGAAILLAVIAWVVLRRPAGADEAESPARLVTDSGVTSVLVDSAALVRAGIVAESLPATEYQRTLTGYGTILDVDSLATARTRLAAALAAATRTASVASAARAELARIQSLNAADQTASTKALQDAETAASSADADAQAARAAARAARATVGQAWGPVVGRWAADGGAALDALLARRRLLLLASLPTGTLLPSPPHRATVRGAGDDVQTTLISAATQTDPETQGATFFYSAPATPGLLAGMHVAVALPAGQPERAVVVPRSAVVWAEGGAWIYVATGPGTFTRRAIATDLPVPGGYALADVAPGTRVVTRGAQLLLSEEYRSHARPVKGDEDEG